MFTNYSLMQNLSFIVGAEEGRFLLNTAINKFFPKSFMEAKDKGGGLVDCSRLVSYTPDHIGYEASIEESEMVFGEYDFYLRDTEGSRNYSSVQTVRLGNVYIMFKQLVANKFSAKVYILDYETRESIKILNISANNICAFHDMFPFYNPRQLHLKGEVKTDPYIQKAANCIRVALLAAATNPDYAKELRAIFSTAFEIHSRSAIGICSRIFRYELIITQPKPKPKPASATSIFNIFAMFTKEADDTAEVEGIAMEDLLARTYEDLKGKLKLKILVVQNVGQELTADELGDLSKEIEIILNDVVTCLSPESANKILTEALVKLNVFSDGYVANPVYESLYNKLNNAKDFVSSLIAKPALAESVSAGAGAGR